MTHGRGAPGAGLMRVERAACDPRERSPHVGSWSERLSCLLGSLLSASPPAPVLALLPFLWSCSLDVQTGLRNALCHGGVGGGVSSQGHQGSEEP